MLILILNLYQFDPTVQGLYGLGYIKFLSLSVFFTGRLQVNEVRNTYNVKKKRAACGKHVGKYM